MILTIEIGNSTITLGGVEGSEIRFECRINTDRVKTSDTYCIDLKTLFEIYGIDMASIEGVIISSVVPQEEGMTAHSSILAWRIPWTEEPGRLQSIGSQRVRQD